MTSRPISGGHAFSPIPERRALVWLALVGVATLTVGALAWAVRAFGVPSVGPDAAAPVIHFQHLVRLEAVDGSLTQTAKPLLTVLYGLAHSVGGWRAVTWLTIFAAALCAALGAVLAFRIGGLLAAAFVGVAFMFSPVLLADVVLGYATPWAALCLIGAALVLTVERPRWGIAGVLLALSALARPEALAVTAFACGSLVVAQVVSRVRREARPPRPAYFLFLGFGAIPVLVVHDTIVMANPLFWAETAQINSAISGNVGSLPPAMVRLAIHLATYLPVVVLALLGSFFLVRRHRWVSVLGLAGATAGIAAFSLVIAARGTSIPLRYYGLMDLAFVFAAGIGVLVLDAPELRRWFRRTIRPGHDAMWLTTIAIGAVLACAAPNWVLDRRQLLAAFEQVRLHENHAAAMAVIRTAVEEMPRDPGSEPEVYVPRRLRVQSIVDLEVPLDRVRRLGPGLVGGTPGFEARAGTIIYHDRIDDRPDAAWDVIEIDEPREIGDVRLVPLLADPDRGMWVVQVEPR